MMQQQTMPYPTTSNYYTEAGSGAGTGECKEAGPEAILKYRPAKDGKMEPRERYPTSIPFFKEQAELMISLFGDCYGELHKQGFLKALEWLIVRHKTSCCPKNREKMREPGHLVST